MEAAADQHLAIALKHGDVDRSGIPGIELEFSGICIGIGIGSGTVWAAAGSKKPANSRVKRARMRGFMRFSAQGPDRSKAKVRPQP